MRHRSIRRAVFAVCAGVVLAALVVADPTATQARSSGSHTPLPLAEYFRVLDACRPPWDATDTNVVTVGGDQLGHEPRSTQQVFLDVWGDLAWQRWRWEVDCLAVARTQPETTPLAMTPKPTTSPVPSPTTPPTDHPDWHRIHEVAVARGADDAVARQVAAYVVTTGSVDDFLTGSHPHVLYGEHACPYQSAACPLAPKREVTEPTVKKKSRRSTTARSSTQGTAPATTPAAPPATPPRHCVEWSSHDAVTRSGRQHIHQCVRMNDDGPGASSLYTTHDPH